MEHTSNGASCSLGPSLGLADMQSLSLQLKKGLFVTGEHHAPEGSLSASDLSWISKASDNDCLIFKYDFYVAFIKL